MFDDGINLGLMIVGCFAVLIIVLVLAFGSGNTIYCVNGQEYIKIHGLTGFTNHLNDDGKPIKCVGK